MTTAVSRISAKPHIPLCLCRGKDIIMTWKRHDHRGKKYEIFRMNTNLIIRFGFRTI